MKIRPFQNLLVIIALFYSCQKKNNDFTQHLPDDSRIKIKYAAGFTVSYSSGYKLVDVKQPYQGSTKGYKYLLVPKGETISHHDPNVKIIPIPITTIVCTSTTHIPLLDYLGETNALIGFPSIDYISSQKTRARVDGGFVTELGIDKGMDLERIALLKPDLVMGYTMTGDLGQFKKIEELGVPVMINSEYLEKHPLGRAEWIKFMALLFDKEDVADSVFNAIEQEYLKAKALVAQVGQKPTVLSGVVYGDAWFLPGGQNYASQLLKDAGCRYLWEDNSSNGFLQLSFESVYEKARQADLWIGVASFKTLKEIEHADSRYTKFKPYQDGNVFTYDARKGAKGGSEFLELGYLRPDIILKDLIRISHPELLPEHELYFHKKLQ